MKGLENHGNTCYFNTALQCLLYIPVLSNYFIRNPYAGDCEFTKLYGDLLKMYWTRGKEHITIKNVIEAFQKEFPRFRTNEQHDVQEAVLCIIDILERSEPISSVGSTEKRFRKLCGRVESHRMKKISAFI